MDPFEKRILGRTGIEVTQLGFGSAHIGELDRKVDEDEAQDAIAAGYEAGISLWDTSPWYGLGLSEHRIGHYLRRQPRDSVAVVTKVGRVLFAPEDPDKVDKEPWVGGLPFNYRFDYRYDAVMRSYEDSLMRLGLNRVEVLLIHDLDHEEHGSEQAVARYMGQLEAGGGFKALDELRSAGQVKAIGAGINQAHMIGRLLTHFDLDVLLVAMPYSLLDQSSLEDLSACARRDVGIIKGAPYASGVLVTGPSPEARFNYARTPEPVFEKVRAIGRVCQRHGVPLGAAALQFLLAHPAVATVIPGAISRAQVLDNIEMMRVEIPGALWVELKTEGLIDADAPTS